MQQFYQITQSKGEKLGNFATYIDFTLDEIRVWFLNLINEGKEGCLLRDWYFYGMSKSLTDSVHYLYNNEAVAHKDLLQEVRMIETEALDLTKVKTTVTIVDIDLEVGGLREEVAIISESVYTAIKSAQQRDHISES